jgi:Flp pilus assembly protein TadG
MMNPLMDIYKRLKKNNKGSLAIEIVIGCFIFLIVLSFVFDLMMMSWKFAVISQTNSYVARTIGLLQASLVEMLNIRPLVRCRLRLNGISKMQE